MHVAGVHEKMCTYQQKHSPEAAWSVILILLP